MEVFSTPPPDRSKETTQVKDGGDQEMGKNTEIKV
jgi:hypothetical protein